MCNIFHKIAHFCPNFLNVRMRLLIFSCGIDTEIQKNLKEKSNKKIAETPTTHLTLVIFS